MKAILFATLMSLAAAVPAFAAETVTVKNTKIDVIRVVGTGTLEVMPDKATVHLGVVTKASTSSKAQSDNAAVVKKLKAALVAKYQIPDQNIKTTSYTVNPEFSEDEPREIIGYVARHSLAITVEFTEGIGELIDTAVSSGANVVDYVQWGLKNQRQYELEALKLAMQDANLRAQAISEAVGRPISRVLKISQGEYSVNAAKSEAAAESSDNIVTEIFPEPLMITAILNVEYGF